MVTDENCIITYLLTYTHTPNLEMLSHLKSCGTKLLKEWQESEKVELLNDVNLPTRYDPVTGKGSVLLRHNI